jgi:hypothetical protein
MMSCGAGINRSSTAERKRILISLKDRVTWPTDVNPGDQEVVDGPIRT